MYKQERHRQIRDYITEHKQADVQTLSSLLGVSAPPSGPISTRWRKPGLSSVFTAEPH